MASQRPQLKTAGPGDRRQSRRFHVEWPVKVRVAEPGGLSFEEDGSLENLSSGGAFFYVERLLPVGTAVVLMIRVPLRKENWLSYSARVVRAQGDQSRVGVATKFDSFRPGFS